jgi:hypothetical protein
MDAGTWTLKCPSCFKLFELELSQDRKIVDAADDEPCPHCHIIPSTQTAKYGLKARHGLAGFRLLKDSKD